VRLAFVTVGDTHRLTGGYLYNARVLAALRKRGVTAEEIIPCGPSPQEQEAAASRFGARLNPRRFDVIVVDALARIVCAPHLDRWRNERPVVAMIHELPSVAAPEKATGEEEGYEVPLLRSDRLISVSGHGSRVLEGRGVPAARIRVVPPGLDRLPTSRAESSVGDGTVRALCVAQWIPRKGVLDLVRAWRLLRERRRASLELIGETDADLAYTASVNAAIAGVSRASISVGGPVDDVALADAYAAADLFALPSRYEGYGIVYAEALAHGLPVVACDVGPLPEVVGEEAAMLVPPGDVEALAGALDLLVNDPAVRTRMSAAALRRAEELPRWEETIAGFLRVLRDVVEERELPGSRGLV
jgi:glycosyltransferase involved in cell wall biosynthesis